MPFSPQGEKAAGPGCRRKHACVGRGGERYRGGFCGGRGLCGRGVTTSLPSHFRVGLSRNISPIFSSLFGRSETRSEISHRSVMNCPRQSQGLPVFQAGKNACPTRLWGRHSCLPSIFAGRQECLSHARSGKRGHVRVVFPEGSNSSNREP